MSEKTWWLCGATIQPYNQPSEQIRFVVCSATEDGACKVAKALVRSKFQNLEDSHVVVLGNAPSPN